MGKYLMALAWPGSVAAILGAALLLTRRVPAARAQPEQARNGGRASGGHRHGRPAASRRFGIPGAAGAATWFILIATAGTVAVVALMCLLGVVVVHQGPAVDRPVFDWVSHNQVHLVTAVMKRLTKIGDTWTTWAAAGTAAVCLAVTWQAKRWLPPLALTCLIGYDHYATLALRHVFHRLGPPVSPLGTYPSGGSDRAVAYYGLIAYLLWHEFSGRRRTAIWAAAAVAALGFDEAYSRVYLSLHWFTDSLSGLLYGTLLLAVFVTAVRLVAGAPAGQSRTRVVRPARLGPGLAAVVTATGVALGGCAAPPPGTAAPGGPASPASPRGVPAASAIAPGPVLMPAAGNYLGAYVEPAQYTAAAKIAAVQAFQAGLGGSLALVHTYHTWNSRFPDAADQYFVTSGKVLLLTWSGTPDTRQISAGRFDAEIRARARAVRLLGRPILMEFRHEMDRPNLQWAVHGPASFIRAWDHIRAIFSQAGATNVGWVWCPTGYGFQQNRARAFYPGNSEVDWVCADIYTATPAQSLAQAAEPFLRWAAGTGKPVLIGEFATGGSATGWPAWLAAAGRLPVQDHQIKAMAYFDANGIDSNGHPFRYWLGSNPLALAAFAGLLASPDFHVKAAGR